MPVIPYMVPLWKLHAALMDNTDITTLVQKNSAGSSKIFIRYISFITNAEVTYYYGD